MSNEPSTEGPALAPVEEPALTSAPAEEAEAPAEEEEPAAEPEEEEPAAGPEGPAAEEGVPPPTQSSSLLEAIPALTGVLAKWCADCDGAPWRDLVFTLDAQGLSQQSANGEDQAAAIPHRQITRVRSAHTEDEACGRPMDCVLLVDIVADQGGETYRLAAASEAERTQWLRRFCAFRRAELAAASALGPSVAFLKDIAESAEYREMVQRYKKLKVADIKKMLVKGTMKQNGAKSELGDGSWSVQINLLSGRQTWCNLPKQATAPTAAQIHDVWLRVYAVSTRCAWENLIDPKLFDTPDRYDSLRDDKVGSYCEYIMKRNPNAILEGEVGEVDTFVSQVLGQPFLAMVEVCEREAHRAGIPLTSMYCWIDEFSLRFPVKDYPTLFRNMISRCGQTLAVLVPWRDPAWVRRAWCVKEAQETVDLNCLFLVGLTAADEEDFTKTLLEDPEKIIELTSLVDIRKATAFNPDDVELIFGMIREMPGDGFVSINATMKGQLRGWVEERAEALLETHRGHATPEAGAAALAYGRLMGGNGLGHKAAARRAIIEALRTVAGLETVVDSDGDPTGEFRAAGGGCLDAEHDTALGLKFALCSTGPMLPSKVVCQGVAAAYARRHGADCAPALEALAFAADTTRYIDKDRARAEFEPLLPRMEAALGPTHKLVLDAKGRYGFLLHTKFQDYAAARPVEEAVVAGYTELYSATHPDTLTARNNLAATFNFLGEHGRARAEVEAVIAGYTEQLGSGHANTLSTQWSLAILLKNQLGDLRGAVELLREVLAAARANPDMGPAHADTTKYAEALAKWEPLAAKVEAGELRFNPQSPWVAWACGERCMYWRNAPFEKSLEAPAEGVKEYAEKERAEYDKYLSSWFPQ